MSLEAAKFNAEQASLGGNNDASQALLADTMGANPFKIAKSDNQPVMVAWNDGYGNDGGNPPVEPHGGGYPEPHDNPEPHGNPEPHPQPIDNSNDQHQGQGQQQGQDQHQG